MGYTTKFSGSIKLQQPLTFAQAKELLEIADADGDDSRGPKDKDRPERGLSLQWVPTETLDAIVWDGGEKFYAYVECMEWLAAWLADRGISAAGLIRYNGEDFNDRGEIIVVDRAVTVKKLDDRAPSTSGNTPLTLAKLGELALAQIAG